MVFIFLAYFTLYNGLSHHPPGDLPSPEIKQASRVAPALEANPLLLSH